jgi:hypothetical protein
LSNSTVCTACPSGRYGSSSSTNASCSGPCAAGFACPAGSTNATAVVCASGKYSFVGASVCLDSLVSYTVSLTADGAASVFAADIDGDGRLDVLSASEADDKIAWYKNSGGGPVVWAAYTIATDVDRAFSVHAADLDGDGLVDVLSASGAKIAWYKNNGGSPVAWTSFTVAPTVQPAYSVFAADVDGDGRQDVLSASGDENKIAWHKNGGGSPLVWTPYTITTGASAAMSVFAVDVDGDGRVDALSASRTDSKIAWYKNGGGVPAAWTPYTISTSACQAQSVSAADIDGDGRQDALSASWCDNSIVWYKNGGGSPVSWTPYTITTTASNAVSVFAADVDGDGRMDVLSASMGDSKIAWYKNGGGNPAVWTPATISTSAVGARLVHAADVDGDGLVDVLSASVGDDKIAWYKNGMCPRGSTGPGGYAPCTPCLPGRFSNTSLLEVCEACPAGRFGAGGSVNASCSGPCAAGFACSAGSVSATAAACLSGKYSLSGASVCSDVLVSYTISANARVATSVFAADVDGDGRLDVLSASGGDNKIAWYKNGGGSPVVWTPFIISSTASGASSVFAADVNGDGLLDVLSASGGNNKIAWYQNGGGSPVVWTPFIISSTASGASSVFAADVNGDGLLDVLSASASDDTIAWYQNGGGSLVNWTPHNVTTAANGARSVYAVDVDGDGLVDVLSASFDDNKIAWYKNGGGSPVVWTPDTISTAARGAFSVYAADVDGDGRIDVLSGSYSDHKVAWYKNGGGSPVVWTPYTITTTGDGPVKVHAADVDGDGRVDVLSAGEYNTNLRIGWFKNGGGSPVLWRRYSVDPIASTAVSVYVADVDGDGLSDVLSASRGDNKIKWYKNMMCPRGSTGPGGYAPCTPCLPGRFSNTSLLEVCEACPAGRFGVGGSVNASCSGPCAAGFACSAGSANATAAACPSGKYSLSGASACSDALVPLTITISAAYAMEVYAVDVDGDGRVDVLSASEADNKIAWYKNGGGDPVVWTPYTITTSANAAHGVFAVDLDNDGRVDVLSASYLDDKIAWYKNGGGSPVTWTAHTITTSADFAFSVCAADLDGDGRLDVLSASGGDDKIAWYKNGGGDPVLWTPYTITTAADGACFVYAADMDGDGRLDVLSASQNDDKIAWYKNGGGSPVAWTPYTITTSADFASSVYAADLDGDGHLDVVSASQLDNKIAWYRNDGGNPIVWAPFPVTTAAYGAFHVHAADVDGDGRVDVLSASHDDDKVSWYRNGGGSPVTWMPYTITTTADAAVSVYAVDVDGDGRLDVLSASFSDHKVAWYRNVMCPRGSFGPAGYAPCSPCPPGRFSNTSLVEMCEACPAGRFGSGGNLNSSCSGPCSAGYACPEGSGNSTASACPTGTYSLAAASVCALCTVGRFGDATAVGSADCSGLCPGGRFGAQAALTVSSCSGACAAGYACPPGSVIPTAVQCAQGQFSHGGAANCSDCTAGTFSDAVGLGVACTLACPSGSFCEAGAAGPTRCPAGRYGAAPSLTNANCTALCPPGSFCASGSTAPALCPSGVLRLLAARLGPS